MQRVETSFGTRAATTTPRRAGAAGAFGVRWWIVVGVWSLPALVASYSQYVAASIQGRPVELWRSLATQYPGWFVWVALTPVIFALARRFPVARRPDMRGILAHLGLLVSALVIYTSVYVWANVQFRRPPLALTQQLFKSVLIGSIVMTLVLYAATLLTSIAMDYASRERDRERRTLELEAQLTRAELHTLRAQLHPHVLFNALHTIALLARRDANEAIRVTVLLGNVLRSVLDSGGTDERPLREEIGLIEQYLAIELVRFADRLSVVWDITDGTQDAMVPTLLLQPLVENALRHGIARSVNGGQVLIAATRTDSAIVVSVWNEGPPLPRNGAERRGVGLRNTEERLQRLYGDAAGLRIANDERGGVIVSVTIPWRAADAAEPIDAGRLSIGGQRRYGLTHEMDPNLVVASTPNR